MSVQCLVNNKLKKSDNETEIRLKANKENGFIKISSCKTETDDTCKRFTIKYLFNIITETSILVDIDISKITALELSGCNLSDIPPALKHLNLINLDLSHNDLQNVPLCLYGGLNHLELLDLSHNKIQNFDLEPNCINYIKKIKLNDNKLENVPKWFLLFRCTNLEEFNYSNNKAKHYKFMKNSFNLNLLKLQKLELRNSCLIDNDFSFLKCFKELQYLDISNDNLNSLNRFDDLDELFVKPKWKNLNILKLNGLSISIFPEGIAWIESLKELHLCDNSLSWLPSDLEYLVNLEILNVSNNMLVSIPSTMFSMEKLVVLQASNNCIECVPDFSSMLNLKTLDLYNNSLNTIPLAIDTIELTDVEYNYCDTTDFKNISLYKERKDNLRKKYPVGERYDGPKEEPLEDLTDSPSEMDKHYESCTYNKNLKPPDFDENENWDLPRKTIKVNSDIDSEDDRWQGEALKASRLRRKSEAERVYISEDDWMFVDCEES